MVSAHPDPIRLLEIDAVRDIVFADRPAWLWDVDAGCIAFANAAGATFFGAGTLGELRKRRFDMTRPGLAQIAGLAGRLPAGGTPQLAMLRFFVGLRDAALPCRCQLVEAGEGVALVLVAATTGRADARPIEARAAVLFDDWSAPVTVVDAGEAVYRNPAAAGAGHDLGWQSHLVASRGGDVRLDVADASAPAGVPEAGGVDVSEPATGDAAAGDATPGGDAEREIDADAVPPMPPVPQRFTFTLDADGRFLEAGPALEAIVGPRSGDIVGRHWADVAGERGLDPDGLVAQALMRRDTWSGIDLEWPADDGGTARVRLAALPRFGDGRVFVGFKGFGDVLALSAPAPRPVDDVSAEPAGGSSGPDRADVTGGSPHPGPAHDAASGEAPATDGDEEAGNVYRLHAARELPMRSNPLNERERTAFEHIAEALGARLPDEADGEGSDGEPPSGPAGDAAPEAVAVHDDHLPVLHDAAPEEESGPPDGSQADESGRDEAGTAHGDAVPSPDRLPVPDADPVPADIAPGVLQRLPVGVAVMRDEMVLFANRACLDLFGYADLDDLEIAGGLAALFAGHSVEASVEPGAVRARRRDGTPVDVVAHMARTPWIDGPAMLVTVRAAVMAEPTEPEAGAPPADGGGDDDTPDRIAELHAILDTATDGVIVLDADGRVETMNRSAEALFGLDEADAAGRPFADLAAGESRAAVVDYLDGLATGGVRSVLNDGREIVGQVARGGAIPLFLTIGRIGEGGPARFCAVIRDLTDWKAAEAELVEARRRAEAASAQKSDFLAKISHEIRTPLNAIVGFAEVILEERLGAIGNDRYRDYVRDIRESGNHIMSLVNDLLDLSKIEAGRLDLAFGSVNLNDIVEQSVAIMQPQANRERIVIRTSLARALPPVVADSRSLRQVMLNILSNAVKFTPPGGQVIVSTVFSDDGEVVVRVRDTGIGMSDADIQIAMEPFRQIAVRPPTRQQGTGLGLPLTRALVEANRASFAIRSRVDEGTLVEVSFPHSRVLAE